MSILQTDQLYNNNCC